MSFLYHVLNSNQTPSSHPNLLPKILFSWFTFLILVLFAGNNTQVQLVANVFNAEFAPAKSRLFLLHFCYSNQWHKLVLELKSTLCSGRCCLTFLYLFTSPQGADCTQQQQITFLRTSFPVISVCPLCL